MRYHHSYYGIPKYINGHARIGAHHTEVAKEKCRKSKLGDKNPMFGKKRSAETNAKSVETRRNNGKPFHSKEVVENVRIALKKYNNEHPGIWVGDKNPNWRGGTCNGPYSFEFNEELKESIRERDNRICQICNKDEEENGMKLCVHHIDYDKDNSEPKNLVSLCIGCHVKTNSRREYWTKFFNIKLENTNE